MPEEVDMKSGRAVLLLVLVFVLAGSVESAEPGSYKAGYSSIMKLGRDLYRALPAEQKNFVSPQPISLETEPSPSLRLLYFPDDPKAVRGVWISAGFIDLINQMAHASAIDRKQPGYFVRYLEILSHPAAQGMLPGLPDGDNPEFWSDEVLNEQLSNFNSIVGVVVGTKLAHHYLGHYAKHRGRLNDGEGSAIPINRLLSENEWNSALDAGVKNALKAGFLVEGAVPFFQAMGKLKNRPPWAEHFLPASADPRKIIDRMEQLQREFLAGE